MAKRILITTSTFPRWSGDTTPPFVAQFANHLSRRGWRVVVLAPHAKGAKTAEQNGAVAIRRYRYFWPEGGETLAYDGGAVAKIKKSPGYIIKLFFLLKALLFHTFWLAVRRKIDIINAHWIIPQGFIAVLVGRVTGSTVVVTVHGSDIFGLNGKWMKRIKAFTLRHADLVVVNSSATLQACRQLCGRPDYRVIPVGVDLERFKPQPPSALLQQKYGLGRFTILFVGRLVEQKGVRYLLEALKQLKATRADFKALVVGEGPEKESLEGYVKANGLAEEVTFAGWVQASELQDYYNIADVFVGPSIVSASGLTEALGIVFIEALACGLPVIATNTGGIADVVDDHKTGILVPERSAEAIFKHLDEFYRHPDRLAELSANGPRSMRAKFSWDGVVDQYAEIFNDHQRSVR